MPPVPTNHTGKKFGRLTALRYIGRQNRGKSDVTLWEFKCDCGTVKALPITDVKDKGTKSCGCLLREVIDHTGNKYHKLTALRCVGRSDDREALWEFRCDCGNFRTVPVKRVLRGSTRSCGCRKRAGFDHTGKKYNRLTALRLVERRRIGKAKTSQHIWEFRCDCGRLTTVNASAVKHGHIKSCGCYRADRKRLPNFGAQYNAAYASHLAAAKLRSFPSYLTKEQYLEIAKKPCRYCGKTSLRHGKSRSTGIPVVACNSVDRLNNEPYYKLWNSVPCCFVCQWMKGSLSEVDFFKHITEVLQFQTAQRSVSDASSSPT